MICCSSQSCFARIDDDQFSAAIESSSDAHCLGGRCRGWVDAPQQNTARMIEIRQRHSDPVGVFRSDATIPRADVIGSEKIWSAESIRQTLQPTIIVNGSAPCGCSAGKYHGFRAGSRFDVVQAQGREIQGLIPRHTHPARIGMTFRA